MDANTLLAAGCGLFKSAALPKQNTAMSSTGLKTPAAPGGFPTGGFGGAMKPGFGAGTPGALKANKPATQPLQPVTNQFKAPQPVQNPAMTPQKPVMNQPPVQQAQKPAALPSNPVRDIQPIAPVGTAPKPGQATQPTKPAAPTSAGYELPPNTQAPQDLNVPEAPGVGQTFDNFVQNMGQDINRSMNAPAPKAPPQGSPGVGGMPAGATTQRSGLLKPVSDADWDALTANQTRQGYATGNLNRGEAESLSPGSTQPQGGGGTTDPFAGISSNAPAFPGFGPTTDPFAAPIPEGGVPGSISAGAPNPFGPPKPQGLAGRLSGGISDMVNQGLGSLTDAVGAAGDAMRGGAPAAAPGDLSMADQAFGTGGGAPGAGMSAMQRLQGADLSGVADAAAKEDGGQAAMSRGLEPPADVPAGPSATDQLAQSADPYGALTGRMEGDANPAPEQPGFGGWDANSAQAATPEAAPAAPAEQTNPYADSRFHEQLGYWNSINQGEVGSETTRGNLITQGGKDRAQQMINHYKGMERSTDAYAKQLQARLDRGEGISPQEQNWMSQRQAFESGTDRDAFNSNRSLASQHLLDQGRQLRSEGGGGWMNSTRGPTASPAQIAGPGAPPSGAAGSAGAQGPAGPPARKLGDMNGITDPAEYQRVAAEDRAALSQQQKQFRDRQTVGNIPVSAMRPDAGPAGAPEATGFAYRQPPRRQSAYGSIW